MSYPVRLRMLIIREMRIRLDNSPPKLQRNVSLAQLAQQAHTQDVHGGDLLNVCPPNIFGELQKRTGTFSIEFYLAKSRLPKRFMLSWVHEVWIEGGEEMANGRSLERHLKYFGLSWTTSEKRSPRRNG